MNAICFEVPPFPTYIKGGRDKFKQGKKHFRRTFKVFDLLIVKSGAMYMCENATKYEIKDYQYLILLPGQEHYGYKACDTETEYYWLHFDLVVPYETKDISEINWGVVFNQEGSYTEAPKHLFHIPTYGEMTNGQFLFNELDRLLALSKTNTPDRHLKEQLVFQQFMLALQTEAIRIPSSAEKVTSQVVSYIQQGYHNENLNMEQIAKQLLFHPDYITRCTQKTLGISPMQYVTRFRLRKAKELLATTNDKLTSIAKQVGIQDSAYFSRLFKKYEGISPLEYRRFITRDRSK